MLEYLLIKLQAFRPAGLLKRGSNREISPTEKFAKFLETSIFKGISQRMVRSAQLTNQTSKNIFACLSSSVSLYVNKTYCIIINESFLPA